MSTKNANQAAPTLRETLRSAMDEEKNKIADDDKELESSNKAADDGRNEDNTDDANESIKKATKEPSDTPEDESTKDDAKNTKDVSEKDASEKDVKDSGEADKVKEAKTDDKKEDKRQIKIPSVPKSIRDKYGDYDPETQDFIAKIVKENLDNKANEGRKAYLREIDQIVTPYMPQLQQINVTPGQLVKRLLEYTDQLSNRNTQYEAIAKLATDFGIDLSLFGRESRASRVDADSAEEESTHLETVIPPELNQKLDSIINEFNNLKASQRTNNDKSAEDAVNNWAGYDAATQEYKNKPYFPYVRQTMYNLIQSGTVPLVNGTIDLDSAYESACFIHPEIREIILEEQAKEKQAAKLEKQRTQQQQITKAKNAGVSFRPSAPSLNSTTSIKNKAPTKDNSVRSAVIAAMNEHRN